MGAPLSRPLSPLLQVVGLVEELCNQTSLFNFLWRAYGSQQQQLRPRWTLAHLASEFSALMAQVGAGGVVVGAGPRHSSCHNACTHRWQAMSP